MPELDVLAHTDMMKWLVSGSVEEWPALCMAVITAVMSKATGGVYRINEAKKETPEDANFVRTRK